MFAAGNFFGMNKSSSPISLSSLRAYYALSDLNDSSGNGFTMTNQGSVTFTSGGINGNRSSYITSGTNPGAANRKLKSTSAILSNTNSTTSTGYSISCWINFSAIPTTSVCTIWDITKSGQRNVFLRYVASGNKYRLATFNGSVEVGFEYSVTPSTSTWYHTCFVMQPTTGSFVVYIDGVSRISGNATSDGNAAASDLYFIGGFDAAAFTMLGHIDEFAIWERAISISEVEALYNSGAGRFYPFS